MRASLWVLARGVSLPLLAGCPLSPPPSTEEPDDGSCSIPGESEVYEADLPANLGDCPWGIECGVDEYLRLPQLFPGLGLDITDDDLDQRLRDRRDNSGSEHQVSDFADLHARILAGTRIDVLREGLADRPLEITVISEGDDLRHWEGEWLGAEVPNLRHRQMLVTDPLVGTLEVVLLLPDGDGPFPAVVVAHGHGDHPFRHIARDDFGEWFVDAGYALVLPYFRASEAGDAETVAARGLLKQGFNLTGVRMYEQLIGRRIAAWVPEVDACAPVGLVGHSGGSVSSNLTVHAQTKGLEFDAYVSDLTSNYFNWNDEPDATYLLDETVPDLWDVSETVNTFELADVPVLRVPYGYTDGIDELVTFFDATIL